LIVRGQETWRVHMSRKGFYKLVALAVMLLLATTALFAQDYLVEYVEGIVEINDGGSWYELYIADTLTETDEIRLEDGAYLELAGPRATIKITRPGTYSVSEIADKNRRHETAGLGGMIAGRISRFSQPEPRTDDTVGGARASEAAQADEPTWVGGESVPELIQEGVELLRNGNYEEAYYVFDEASYYAYGEDKPEADFYLGYAASLIGEMQTAISSLAANEPDPETEYYDTHVLTLADLYVQTFEYQEARELLASYLEEGSEDESSVQLAHLLHGLSLEGTGNVEQARVAFQTAERIAPETAAGRAAAGLCPD
jgi:tetratricopeptide (TPR) repeat protein